MATQVKVVSFFVLGLLLLSANGGHGRLLKEEQKECALTSSRFHGGEDVKGVDSFEVVFKELSLEAVKNSGPSPGGGGHRFEKVDTLGGVKKSGPSPGEGH